jgi:hypothetical protein
MRVHRSVAGLELVLLLHGLLDVGRKSWAVNTNGLHCKFLKLSMIISVHYKLLHTVCSIVILAMLKRCCCGIAVTVDSTGIVWGRPIARCRTAPSNARDACGTLSAHPIVARGPMALALRLVHNEIIMLAAQ